MVEQILYRELVSKFHLCFDTDIVPFTVIQPGVIKCTAPPHNVGSVLLRLQYDGKALNNG